MSATHANSSTRTCMRPLPLYNKLVCVHKDACQPEDMFDIAIPAIPSTDHLLTCCMRACMHVCEPSGIMYPPATAFVGEPAPEFTTNAVVDGEIVSWRIMGPQSCSSLLSVPGVWDVMMARR